MHALLNLLDGAVGRLNRRGQRLLLVSCTAMMAVFAGTTTAAAQAGDYPELTAGLIMVAVCATVWSARRGRTR